MQTLVSSANARAVVLAKLRLTEPIEVRQLSAMVGRIASGTSLVSLGLYKLDHTGARAHDPSNLDLTRRRFRRLDTGLAPITAVTQANNLDPVTRTFSRGIRLDPNFATYFAAMQVDGTDAMPLVSPAYDGTNYSRNLLAGIVCAPIPSTMGDLPTDLRFVQYAPLPLIAAYDAEGAYASLVRLTS